MDAAYIHLQAVTNAQNEHEILTAMLGAVKTDAEATINRLDATITLTIEKTQAALGAANETKNTTEQATIIGEEHLNIVTQTGHGTRTYAQNAYESCSMADTTISGLQNGVDEILVALNEAKTKAQEAVATATATIDDLITGTEVAQGHLSEAETSINNAIAAGQ